MTDVPYDYRFIRLHRPFFPFADDFSGGINNTSKLISGLKYRRLERVGYSSGQAAFGSITFLCLPTLTKSLRMPGLGTSQTG